MNLLDIIFDSWEIEYDKLSEEEQEEWLTNKINQLCDK